MLESRLFRIGLNQRELEWEKDCNSLYGSIYRKRDGTVNWKKACKGILRKCRNKSLNSLNQIYFITHKKKYPIKGYQNKYEGQSCFVIGNGPSLQAEDLNQIKRLGKISFAANRIYNIFPKTDWRPDYIAVSDSVFIYDRDILHKIENIGAEMFFMPDLYALKTAKLKCGTCPIKTNGSRSLLDSPRFSENCNDIIFDIATVTYYLLQIAVYMGFKEIYLIGMDNKYKYSKLRDGTVIRNEGIVSYFDGGNEDIPSPDVVCATWELDVAYEYAEKYSREHGFRIYNATRGGYLEKFERRDLDAVFKNMGMREGSQYKMGSNCFD